MLLLGVPYARAQEQTVTESPKSTESVRITGQVTDEQGNPLLGVTVFAEGFSAGTATDGDGRYSLLVPGEKKFTLVYSYIGMLTRRIAYSGKNMINVVMKEDVTVLDEVVATGYQTMRKRDVVGSMAIVKAKDVMMPAFTTIDQMLQGQVSGMMVMNSSARVGTSPKITIRGTSTLLGNQDPLWVVDGVIQPDNLPFDISTSMTEDLKTMLGNQISWLNPNDIETITVLKDASATAVYGAKASNGVIVITTKKGGRDGRLSVNYTHNSSWRMAPKYSNFNFMNSQERIEFTQEAFGAGMKYLSEPIMDPATYEGLMRLYLAHEIPESKFMEEVRKLETGNTDWLDLLTRNSYSQNHSLSIGGGTDKVTYNISAGYSDNKGTEKGSDSRTMSGRINVTAFPHPRVTVSGSLSATSTKTDGFGPGVSPLAYATSTSRAIRAFDDNGDYNYYLRETGYRHAGRGTYLKYNILNEMNHSSSLSRIDNVNASINFSWRITDWLEYQFVGGYAYNKTYNQTYADEETFYIADNYRGYEMGSVVPNSPCSIPRYCLTEESC